MKRSCIILFALAVNLLSNPAYSEEPPLKLLATAVGNFGSAATCGIMNLPTGEESVHRIGDKVSGYQIVMITRGSITLLKDGQYYFLNLLPGNENMPLANNEALASSISIKRTFFETALDNLNNVLDQATLTPYIESGKVAGLKIPSVDNKAMELFLRIAGLREGDVATSINGETVDSIKKALELYNKYKDQPSIEVEVKRGDSVKNLNYFLN